MSTQTSNLQLIKPDASEFYDLNVFNENADKIDASIAELQRQAKEFVLTVSKTVYVDANTGSDELGDGTEDKPWKTIQKAFDACPANTDGYSYEIAVADGIYDEEVTISDKAGQIYLNAATTLEGAENVVIKHINCRSVSFLHLRGVKLTGNNNAFSKVGLAASSTTIYASLCKFDDCIVRANVGGEVNLMVCDFSNYRTGSYAYGAIHANGGVIKCYQVSGTNNKAGYGGGSASSTGGDIYVTDDCTLEADELIIENYTGHVRYRAGRFEFIGNVDGAKSISINTKLYTEFLVKVHVPEFGKFTYTLIPIELSEIEYLYCAGTTLNANTTAHTAIKASKTSITLYQVMTNGVSVIDSSSMAVYARRT